MTERSRFWDGVATGDATEAPYDAPTEFAAVLRSLSGAASVTTNLGGVFDAELNELAVTGATSPVSVASGRALAYGNWYESDAAVNVAIPTPAASTRIDRIVLRKDWTAQTVRITRIAGVEGGAAPALVQIAGTTWDTPLAQASITTGGAITLTDQREFIPRANAAVHAHSSSIDGGDGPLTIADANYYSWLSANSPRMYRDAADVIAFKRTTNPQEARVYGTTTGPAYLSLRHSGSHSYVNSFVGDLNLQTAGVSRWIIDRTVFSIYPGTDNGYDLGDPTQRVRTGYFGTSTVLGANADANTRAHIINAASGQFRGITLQTAGAEVFFAGMDSANTYVIRRGGASNPITVSATSGITLSEFTDITAGGLRVKGQGTAPSADAGNVNSIGILSAGSNAGANDTYACFQIYKTNTFFGGFGFDPASAVGTIAGVVSTNADFSFRTGPGGVYRAFIDDSDSGTLVLGGNLKSANNVWIQSSATTRIGLIGSPTGNRDATFPDISGTVMLGFSKRKDADESVNNTTTLQNDDALVGPVKANTTYSFVIELPRIDEAVADMNLQVALDLPAGSVLNSWLVADGAIGAAAVYGQATVEMVAEATGYTINFSNAGAASCRARITGYFTVGGSDGNAQFQWAQGNPVVGNLTIQSGATFDALAVA